MYSNRDSRMIHETVIKDIFDVMHDLKDSDEVQMLANRNNHKSFSSIAKASSNLTLEFPVLCTNTLNIETAAMIAKAIERKCVTMLQLLFSAMSVSDTDDAFEYLQQFHTNLKGKVTIDDYLNMMETIATESGELLFPQDVMEAVRNDMRNINYTLPDSLNERSLQDYKVTDNIGSSIYVSCLSEAPKYVSPKELSDTMNATSKNTEFFVKQMLDSDVKKCNELVPSLMIVRMISKDSKCIQQFIVGVKARLIPMDSYDITERIKIKNEDHKGLLKFLRATTREISFFKDFVFAIDKAKLDALSYSKRGSSSKMWKVLERRSTKGNIRTGLSMKNDATRIATLVISQEEVNYLKKDGVDIDSGKVATSIMESYALMGFVIADESLEVARFLFDTGDDSFEDLSFRHLERESSDNNYRKIINLMSKMR